MMKMLNILNRLFNARRKPEDFSDFKADTITRIGNLELRFESFNGKDFTIWVGFGYWNWVIACFSIRYDEFKPIYDNGTFSYMDETINLYDGIMEDIDKKVRDRFGEDMTRLTEKDKIKLKKWVSNCIDTMIETWKM